MKLLLFIAIFMSLQIESNILYQKSFNLGVSKRELAIEIINDSLIVRLMTNFEKNTTLSEEPGQVAGTHEVVVSENRDNLFKVVIHPGHLLIFGASRILKNNTDGLVEECIQDIQGKTYSIPLNYQVVPKSVMASLIMEF